MKENLLSYFPQNLKEELRDCDFSKAEEIRVRVGQPLEVLFADFRFTGTVLCEKNKLLEICNYLSGYSLYALEEEIKNGFFTIPGGHRVGLCGHVSFHENLGKNEADFLTNISGLNIRIAHERKGCAKGLIPYICKEKAVCNTLFFSLPGIGKTTYLRDVIRILSKGEGLLTSYKIGVVDERSELGASFGGRMQNDLGPRTDLLDNCPKELGMRMLIRSMSPDVIAVDELGKEQDFLAVSDALSAGIKILGTVHANTKEEVLKKPHMEKLLGESEWRFVRIARREDGKRCVTVYFPRDGKVEEGILCG